LLLIVNLVRLAVIALFIQWFVASFGLVGAVLVTVLALAVGKLLGLIAMTGRWRVGVQHMLPWRALSLIGAIAMAAGLPAFAVAYGLQMNPSFRIVIAGTVYVSAYVGMAMGFGLLSAQEWAALSQLMDRLQFVRGIRYQHKAS
jgi:hypothetical protein